MKNGAWGAMGAIAILGAIGAARKRRQGSRYTINYRPSPSIRDLKASNKTAEVELEIGITPYDIRVEVAGFPASWDIDQVASFAENYVQELDWNSTEATDIRVETAEDLRMHLSHYVDLEKAVSVGASFFDSDGNYIT
jgi:hypothetical protein